MTSTTDQPTWGKHPCNAQSLVPAHTPKVPCHKCTRVSHFISRTGAHGWSQALAAHPPLNPRPTQLHAFSHLVPTCSCTL